MASIKVRSLCCLVVMLCLSVLTASAQSFRVQCPQATITHPNASANNSEPAYNGPTVFGAVPVVGTTGGYVTPTSNINGAIKCQQISGGDGLSTMADGTQIYIFSFGPLSGLADIAAGLPGTQFPSTFNTMYPGTLVRGDPAATDGAMDGSTPGTAVPESAAAFTWNGAVGLTPDIANVVTITNILEGTPPSPATACATSGAGAPGATTVQVYTDAPLGLPVGSSITIANSKGSTTAAGFLGTYTITCVNNNAMSPDGLVGFVLTYTDTAGLPANTGNDNAGTISAAQEIDGHVDPRQIMDVGVMNGNIPAPLIAFDEDDELFLTLTNVGMIQRPDLFEQHTVHFHGYPNASSFYDGVPDASVAINIGGSFTYYYLAPDAGTYFWHCHITPPEHLQMGMVGQLYVRPRQNRVPVGQGLYHALQLQNGQVAGHLDLRTACSPAADILCSAVTPAVSNTVLQTLDSNVLDPTNGLADLPYKYVYNDGDASTQVDVEYPIQMHGFDPNFHFVGMTFNPEMFVDMKDKYFLLNGRSYPDTVGQCGGTITSCAPGPQATITTDGQMHYSQPLPALINIPAGGKASLRLVNLSVAEYHTLGTMGMPMKVVGWNAKLLRDQAGNNTEYYANSVTLGGGESADVILDASNTTLYPPGSVFYLYTPNLDHLANDAENFGGMMTEIHICNGTVNGSTFGNTCN